MLNEKQLEAVNTMSGPVVIIAGPGTGKTKTLVERVVNILVNKKVDPSKIVLTTFTNKSARELEIRINEKLEEINKNIDISNMYIGTMHSIWLRLIQENIEYSNFFDGFELMTSDYEQHFFIYSKLKEYKKLENYKEFFDNLFLVEDWKISSYIKKKINDFNENGIKIKDIRSSDKDVNFIKDIYKLYEKNLFEENKLDFPYLQVEFLNMLEKNPNLLTRINDKIEYLMVDEYQDSNKIQEKILLLISKNKKNICVVGDEDQSIYRFRGATSENIVNFYKKFENCKLIILDKNYRSVSEIVEFNNKWIKSLDWKGQRLDKNITSARTDGILNSSVVRIEDNSRDNVLKKTVKFIKDLKEKNKIVDYNQVAVLFSTFKDSSAKKLESFLLKEGIEVFSPRTKIFFDAREIKLSFGLILAFFKKYVVLDSYLKECLNIARYESKNDEKLFNFIINKIKNIEEIEVESLNEFLYELFQFEIYKKFLLEKDVKNLKACRNLSVLSKILKSFQKYVNYQNISLKNDFKVVKYFFEKYISILKKSRIEDIYNEEDYPSGCVPFLTIHQSKGLEFPVVIVFSLQTKPNVSSINSDLTSIERLVKKDTNISDVDKEYFDFYRKFYVAFTRAKNLLVLSASSQEISENFKSFFYAIPSVNGLGFNIDEIEIDKISDKKDKKIISFTTDLLTYEVCPLKYNFLMKEEFQTYSKNKFNFGLVLHTLIEYINKRLSQDKNVNFSKEKIEDLLRKTLSFKKIKLENSFDRMVDILFKYIEKEKENFKYPLKVEASEYRIEQDYTLYGKIDMIVEKEDSIELIDFKSGKYHKDSIYTENYRRQLSLYKFLLEKKYRGKEIKTFLYYLEEDEAKKYMEINEKDMKNDYELIDKTARNILEGNYLKREFDTKICLECEFKYYCYGDVGI